MDTLVSNKALPQEIRHEGIKLLVETLIKRAKELKLKGIIAFTSDAGTLERAEAIGFRVDAQTVITLPLI